MRIGRATLVKLVSLGGMAAVARACEHFGLGTPEVSLFAESFAVLGSAAHAGAGHVLLDFVHGWADRAGRDKARESQNHDLHRLIGVAIARVLERVVEREPKKFGGDYLSRAAAAFRGDAWMEVELTGRETLVSEPEIHRYFKGDSEAANKELALTPDEWTDLLEKVAGATPLGDFTAREHAAAKLSDHFEAELRDAAKDAWQERDLVWPALTLRLLSLILGSAARQSDELRKAVQTLSDRIGALAAAATRDPAVDREMLAAIAESRNELALKLDRIEAIMLREFADVKATLSSHRPRKVVRSIEFSSLIEPKAGGLYGKFVGREWLAEKLDFFLNSHDRGYFVLEGDTGIGKTAFCSWLASERGYVHHFNDVSIAVRRLDQFTANVSARIIERWIPGEPEPSERELYDGAYLSELLPKAARNLKAGEKLVVVVDALDEVEECADANTLALPRNLPRGVYFVCTTRPGRVQLSTQAPVETFSWNSDSAQNLDDIRRFLELAAVREDMAFKLREYNKSAADFVSILLETSEGNHMYLYYVLPEIESGKYPGLKVGVLPRGLEGYYQQHCDRMRRDKDRWFRVLLPVVSVLAVSHKPLTIEEIMRFVTRGIPSFGALTKPEVREVLDEWRQFLAKSPDDGRDCYRIYHNSFRDYLARLEAVKDTIG